MRIAVVFAMLLVSLPALSQSGSAGPAAYDVSIVAGIDDLSGIQDGVGQEAVFLKAGAMWGDGTYLYVVDGTALRRIEIATRQVTTITRLAGTGRYSPDGSAYVTGLTGVWGDGSYVYVTDVGDGSVRRVNPSTGFVDVIAQIARARGIVGDGQSLYAGDSAQHNILKLDIPGDALTTLATLSGPFDPPGCNGTGCIGYLLPSPTSLSIDGDNIYATGFATSLRIINRLTGQVTSSPTLPFIPRTVWGGGGVVYFSDGYQVGKLVLATGDISIILAGALIGDPVIALWGDPNYLYVSQTDHIVRMDLSTGSVQSFAGLSSTPTDGVGTAARFGTMLRVWSDGASLFSIDSTLNRIRKVSLATGEVTTLPTPTPARGLWGDGTYLYVTETNGTNLPGADPSAGIVQRIRLSDGNTTTFGPTQYPGGAIWGDGTALYVSESGQLQRVPLDGSAFSTVTTGLGTQNLWGDGSNFYMDLCTLQFCNQLLRYSIATGQTSVFATLPDNGVSGIWGGGQNLFVTSGETGRVWRISVATGQIDPLIHGGTGPDAGKLLNGLSGPIWGDGTNLYIVAAHAIYKLTPSAVPAFSGFQAPDRGASSNVTASTADSITVASGSIELDASSAAVSGFAIFTYRQNGIVISEASVPASAPILSGRIYASTAGPVETGLAIMNPNEQPAAISFYFTDAAGNNVSAGSFTIPARGQIARFLSEDPFFSASPAGTPVVAVGTLTFTSSVPVSAIALRGYINERSEFLMTALPVADLSAVISMDPVVLAHFADGGGWMTSVILVNPTDQTIGGNIEFHADDGSLLNSTPYAISPRSSFVYTTPNSNPQTQAGSVRVVPAASTAAPSGVSVFSFRQNGIVVTEAGAPAITPNTSFRLYTEVEGTGFLQGGLGFGLGSLETGFAIANPSSSSITVFFQFTGADGIPVATAQPFTNSLTIPAQGHVSLFMEQLGGPVLDNRSVYYGTGVLRLWTDSTAGISMTGLRARYNERNDFLITNTPPAPEVANATPTPLYFPHIVEGGGYTTQIVVFGNTPGRNSSGVISYFSQSGAPLTVPLN